MKEVYRIKFKNFLTVFLLLMVLTSFVFSAAAQSSKPIELKYAYPEVPGTTGHKLILTWSERIEKATDGRVKIVQFPAQSLMKDKDTMIAVQQGVADIVRPPIATFPGMFNLTEVMFLPFLGTTASPKIPSYELNTLVINELLETVPEVQKEFDKFHVTHIWGQETYCIATAKKPIHTLEDIKGMKIRVVGRYAVKAVEALGATPVSMPVADIYDAATKGVIDGAFVISDFIDSFKIHQVLPYWTRLPLWSSIQVNLINKEKWDSLPVDIQEHIMNESGVDWAIEQSRVKFGPEAVKRNEEIMAKDGKYVTWYDMPEDEIARWKERAGAPIWDEWVREMEGKGLAGQKVLDKVIELYKKYE